MEDKEERIAIIAEGMKVSQKDAEAIYNQQMKGKVSESSQVWANEQVMRIRLAKKVKVKPRSYIDG